MKNRRANALYILFLHFMLLKIKHFIFKYLLSFRSKTASLSQTTNWLAQWFSTFFMLLHTFCELATHQECPNYRQMWHCWWILCNKSFELSLRILRHWKKLATNLNSISQTALTETNNNGKKYKENFIRLRPVGRWFKNIFLKKIWNFVSFVWRGHNWITSRFFFN